VFILSQPKLGGGFIDEEDQLPVCHAALTWWRLETHLHVERHSSRVLTCARADFSRKFFKRSTRVNRPRRFGRIVFVVCLFVFFKPGRTNAVESTNRKCTSLQVREPLCCHLCYLYVRRREEEQKVKHVI